jgi:hypothetical protein
MTSESAGPQGDAEHVYTYRPSLLGAPWTFRLLPTGLSFEAGRRAGLVPYRDIHRVRLSFRPISMQTHRYQTEIWAAGAPKLVIVSSTWKSMVEQQRLDDAYAAFVTELHARVATAGGATRFEQGAHPLRYWPGLAIFAAVALGFAFLVLRALQSDAVAGAVFVGAFLGLLLWHGGNYFRRNRPGVYTPDALPQLLVPGT